MINQMGRIVTNVKIKNLLHPEVPLSCDALVDTGAAYLVPPLRLFNTAGWSRWLGSVVVTIWALSAPAVADPGSTNFSPQQIEFFEKQVQPILAENCYKCHSHQADKIKGSFVLDSPFVLLGTHEQMAEALVKRQHRFGVSYWTVFDEWVGRASAMSDIAKVIALLR